MLWKFLKLSLLIATVGTLGACSKESLKTRGGFQAGPMEDYVPYKTSDTEVFDQPIVIEKEDLRFIKGATSLVDSEVRWHAQKREVEFLGSIKVKTQVDKEETVQVHLRGAVGESGEVLLKQVRPLSATETDDSSWSVGGKALCLNPDLETGKLTCDKAVIDVFLRLGDEKIFQHQVVYTSTPKLEEPQLKKEVSLDVEEEGSPDEGQAVPEDEEVSEDDVSEERPMGVETTVTKEELEVIVPKKTTPKKEEPKSDDPKKEEPKKEEPKRDETKKEEPKKDKEPTDRSGEIDNTRRPINKYQVYGRVNDGSLVNGVNMLEKQKALGEAAGFHMIRVDRKRYFTSDEMAHVIVGLGGWLYKWLKKYDLIIGDLSSKNGGRIGTHKSHQNGLDADIGYIFKDSDYKNFQYAVVKNRLNPQLLLEANWYLFKTAVSSKKVNVMFMHRKVKKALCDLAIRRGELKEGDRSNLAYETLRRIYPDTQHNSHFHLRVNCPAGARACFQTSLAAKSSGCF